MKIERNIHSGYVEWERMPETSKTGFLSKCMFGKYQYICSDEVEVNRISVIHLDMRMKGVKGIRALDVFWEIYQTRGKGLIDGDDIERFNTKKEAVDRCRSLLG